MKTVSILVADDHEVVRSGLCRLLEAQPNWKTLEAGSGHEAVSKATMLHPDVVIMDIHMPHLNGLDAARQTHHLVPNVPIVVLSADSDDQMIDKALEAGVQGYVLKTDAVKELVAAVQAVLQKRTFFTAVVSRHLLDCMRRLTTRETSALTVREVEIIQLLCEGKSNKEVANDLGLSSRTVESHRAHIMTKLCLHSFSDLIRYALRHAIIQL
jgi:DNA-binding NarL/FixJ family response regulator